MTEPAGLTGLYTESNDILLSGDRVTFQLLANAVSTQEPVYLLTLEIPPTNRVAPYTHILSTIRIVADEGFVSISRFGSILEIRGSKEKREVLSENLIWFSDSTTLGDVESSHLHIEYFPGHYYLAATSLPIVVALNDKDK